jgi:hypothetical protein
MQRLMKTKGIVAIFMSVLLLFCTNSICGEERFESVRCGSDIGKALLGRTVSNEKLVVLEERHKDVGLKYLWGHELFSHLVLQSWRICGEEYVLFYDQDSVARDVLKFPQPSKDSPQFLGACLLNGQMVPASVIGVLKNEGGGEMFPAVIAWTIDEKQTKFVELQTEGLRCYPAQISEREKIQ